MPNQWWVSCRGSCMTTPTAELLTELLDDAKRIAAYGQRTGRLRDNELISAIAAAEKLPVLDWGAPEIITLQAALNRALMAIAPTNLADLRSSWDPFASTRTSKPLVFVAVTLILMFITALATFEYNRGVALLRGVESLQTSDPRAKIGSIARQLLALNANVQDGEQGRQIDEPHFALIDQLHEIDGQLQFYLPAMSQFRADHQLPHELLGKVVKDTASFVGGWLSPATAATQPGAADAAPSGDSSKDEPIGEITCQSRGEPTTNPYISSFGQTPVAIMLMDYVANTLDLVCVEGIKNPPTTIPSYAGFIVDMNDWSNVWGSWYLPALYGALGAMLYYMRRILDPTIPNPPAIRILHRTALGAFAGVVVTWFWVPNSELSQGFSTIGLTVFTVAFLVGFGIEVLFALLDRLVSALVDLAKGEPPPPAPTQGSR